MNTKFQTVIFFCRHGQTDKPYTTEEKVDAERLLTASGKEQITKVGRYLSAFAPSAIYSSPLRRTLETAEIIRQEAGISPAVISRDELLEIYSDGDYRALSKKIPALMKELVAKHPGEHIILTSHQDVIEGGLRALDVEADEAQFPCQMAQLYRLVFADSILVEVSKLDPAASVR